VRIHVIETGRVLIKKANIIGHGHGILRQLRTIVSRRWADWAPVYCFAIEHEDGIIVVDTGSASHMTSLPIWHPYHQLAVRFDISPEEEVGSRLRALGIDPAKVPTVVLTHMHMDHEGGVSHFPNSRILAGKAEIAYSAGIMGRLRGYLPERRPAWFRPEELPDGDVSIGPFNDAVALTRQGDVLALPTPGHTPGHTSVLVRDGDVWVLLAGDASYLQSTMLAGLVDGVSSDECRAKQTLVKLRQLAASLPLVYVPAHDPHGPERLARREVVIVPHNEPQHDWWHD